MQSASPLLDDSGDAANPHWRAAVETNHCDLKKRLNRIIEDPHFANRERDLARASLRHIEHLESRVVLHWTEMAWIELIREVQEGIIGRQAATKIHSFLKRHLPGDA